MVLDDKPCYVIDVLLLLLTSLPHVFLCYWYVIIVVIIIITITNMHWRVWLLFFLSDAVEENRVQAEERGNKLKQLLLKTKKELADSRKQARNNEIVTER